ncbi:hypothetical protein [Vibrio sp. C8]
MNKSLFPFVAGQRTDKLFGSSHVLSPLPVKTLLPKAKQCDQLIKKNEHYIDLGGRDDFANPNDVDIFLNRFFLVRLVLYCF